MTAVYHTCFDRPCDKGWFGSQLESLPSDIQKRISTLRRWQDAHACTYGKLLLRKMLCDFGLTLKLEDLNYTKYQRPFFKNCTFDFNISHSGNYVVCAGSHDTKIGVDIEEVKPLHISDFRSYFHDDEMEQISGSENTLGAFYEYWTKKEALIKADGRGLTIALNEINLCKSPERIRLDGTSWNLKALMLDDRYKCSIAYSEEIIGFLTVKQVKGNCDSFV